jgi:hypothetical protein
LSPSPPADVEQAFFQRWVEEADPEDLADMKQLVADGQLEFVNGGWCESSVVRRW